MMNKWKKVGMSSTVMDRVDVDEKELERRRKETREDLTRSIASVMKLGGQLPIGPRAGRYRRELKRIIVGAAGELRHNNFANRAAVE
mmetsp:Transcript_4649/g.11731  ORF Transcript_4649/g.11731 Transcript_4649/m.11731 type:complete len:87 (+) Transcript_4649:489-749(+)